MIELGASVNPDGISLINKLKSLRMELSRANVRISSAWDFLNIPHDHHLTDALADLIWQLENANNLVNQEIGKLIQDDPMQVDPGTLYYLLDHHYEVEDKDSVKEFLLKYPQYINALCYLRGYIQEHLAKGYKPSLMINLERKIKINVPVLSSFTLHRTLEMDLRQKLENQLLPDTSLRQFSFLDVSRVDQEIGKLTE